MTRLHRDYTEVQQASCEGSYTHRACCPFCRVRKPCTGLHQSQEWFLSVASSLCISHYLLKISNSHVNCSQKSESLICWLTAPASCRPRLLTAISHLLHIFTPNHIYLRDTNTSARLRMDTLGSMFHFLWTTRALLVNSNCNSPYCEADKFIPITISMAA